MESNFEEVLKETYENTLKLAVGIAQNKANLMSSNINSNDLKFVKKIAKDYKDFKELNNRGRLRKKKIEEPSDSPILSPLKYNKTGFLPKNSGKQKLNISLEERKKFVSGSKAGKPIQYAEIGPNILEKIKTSVSIYSEESRLSLHDSKILPHVSIRTGKVKPALELPSFKEYVKSERSKDPRDIALEKISHCNFKLAEFEKEMAGLELFVSNNPGVIWNNDKKVLMRLHAFPNQKALIIKAYNDQLEQSLIHKRKTTKKTTILEREEKIAKADKFLSKTPNPQSMEDYYFKKKRVIEDAGVIVSRCYSRFQNARDNQNKKLISILESLSLTRSVKLKQKAIYILNDKEKFKDKLYSIQKMDQIKKKIDWDQETRLKKSKEQAVIYDKLMEFLKRKQNGPSDLEINFVEILKEILEEGWYIDDSLISKLIEVTPPEDSKELGPLMEFLQAELNTIENN